MRPLAFAFAGAIAAAALSPAPARAFCRSSVCANGMEGKRCTPAEPDDCGTPLVWKQPCVGFDVQKNASNQVSWDVADQVLGEAMSAWMSVACNGGPPTIGVTDLGTVNCGAVEYNEHAGNANILVFRDDKWPYTNAADGSTDTIALTTVTYDTTNGDIFDADIEVNTANFTFSTDDAASATDLLSVLTHESGHFLGLAHSPVAGATMFPNYGGGTELRSLAQDDQLAICTVYPIDRNTEGKCTSLPRHGFSADCASKQVEGRCAVATPGEDGSGGAWTALVLGALASLVRRRRR